MKGAVLGVGTSKFGKQPDVPLVQLAYDAISEALESAGGDKIEAVYVGTVFGASGVAQRALSACGIVGVPIVMVENACASGTTAFHEAVSSVELGRYSRVLAVGLEQMSTLFDGGIVPEKTDSEGATGLAMPAMYALAATRYRHDFGLRDEDLAAVAVKNYANARDNHRAHRSGHFSIEDVLRSRPVADPLTVLQCSPISDGAAAAVVGGASGAAGEVRVLSSVLLSGIHWGATSDRVWGFDLVRRTANAAYEHAGVGIEDVDLVELHDAFTIGEIVTSEALGIAGLGEGASLAATGQTARSGRLPVNPSGGLLGRGHPLGATGLAQIAEVFWQLRHLAGPRQIDGARIGLVETMGGGAAGLDGNACVVSLLGTSG